MSEAAKPKYIDVCNYIASTINLYFITNLTGEQVFNAHPKGDLSFLQELKAICDHHNQHMPRPRAENRIKIHDKYMDGPWEQIRWILWLWR